MFNEKREFYKYLRSIKNYNKLCKLLSLYIQHGDTTVLLHSRNVSYYSFIVARRLEKKYKIKFNYEKLVIGAFLHDLFLYDWHERGHKLHGLLHPTLASCNAKKMCNVSKDIQDVIETHMWPLTITKIPKSKEAFLVNLIDKYLSVIETFTRKRTLGV